MQLISSLRVLKYLFKYIHKGGDRAVVPEEGPHPRPNANAGGGGNGANGGNGAIGANGANGEAAGNGADGDAAGNGGAEGNGAEQLPQIKEIKRYQDMRYFGSCEAAWRLFGFGVHNQHPATMKLRIHLEDHQAVYFEEGDEEAVTDRGPPETHLTAWFALNAQAAENEEETPPAFVMMPRTYMWDQPRREWRLKARGDNGTVGRLPFISPSAGEVFYLRMLLLHEQTCGAKSFQDVRTVHGEVCATFRDACLALGLLRDDNQWHDTMATANEHMMPSELRGLFVTILEFNSPSDPKRLLDAFVGRRTDDFARNMRGERDRGERDAVAIMKLICAGRFCSWTSSSVSRRLRLIGTVSTSSLPARVGHVRCVYSSVSRTTHVRSRAIARRAAKATKKATRRIKSSRTSSPSIAGCTRKRSKSIGTG